MSLPIGQATAQTAALAYRLADAAGSGATDAAAGAIGDPSGGSVGSFSAMLERAAAGAIESGHQADAAAASAITGSGSLTEVTSAVARAELTLQTAIALRDRMVQAYQDIMHISI
jgi:flagellar hook-basal body complex protein FliE